jgi:hypothetical protein
MTDQAADRVERLASAIVDILTSESDDREKVRQYNANVCRELMQLELKHPDDARRITDTGSYKSLKAILDRVSSAAEKRDPPPHDPLQAANLPKIPKVIKNAPDEINDLSSTVAPARVEGTLPPPKDFFSATRKYTERALNFYVYGDKTSPEYVKQRKAFLRAIVAKVRAVYD